MANINLNLFKSWVAKSIPESLITGLNGLTLKCPKEVFSGYSKSPAKIRPQIVSAFCKVSNILKEGKDGKNVGALGTFYVSGGSCLAIEIQEGEERQAAIIKNNKVYACVSNGMPYSFKEGHENGVLLLAAIIFAEGQNPRNAEFKSVFSRAYKLFFNGITTDNVSEFSSLMAVLSENIYRRLCGSKDKITISPLSDTGNVGRITQLMLNSGVYEPAPISGSSQFKILGSEATKETV